MALHGNTFLLAKAQQNCQWHTLEKKSQQYLRFSEQTFLAAHLRIYQNSNTYFCFKLPRQHLSKMFGVLWKTDLLFLGDRCIFCWTISACTFVLSSAVRTGSNTNNRYARPFLCQGKLIFRISHAASVQPKQTHCWHTSSEVSVFLELYFWRTLLTCGVLPTASLMKMPRVNPLSQASHAKLDRHVCKPLSSFLPVVLALGRREPWYRWRLIPKLKKKHTNNRPFCSLDPESHGARAHILQHFHTLPGSVCRIQDWGQGSQTFLEFKNWPKMSTKMKSSHLCWKIWRRWEIEALLNLLEDSTLLQLQQRHFIVKTHSTCHLPSTYWKENVWTMFCFANHRRQLEWRSCTRPRCQVK